MHACGQDGRQACRYAIGRRASALLRCQRCCRGPGRRGTAEVLTWRFHPIGDDDCHVQCHCFMIPIASLH